MRERPPAPAKLRVEHVRKQFDDPRSAGVEAIRDASLEVGEGEFAALIGPSGCGKSTLLYLVAGFLRPSGGTLSLDGRPITGPGPDRGIVFQDYSLFPWLTVEQNIRFGPNAQRLGDGVTGPRVRHLLELTGLIGFERAYPHQLSGGMQQRVGLARALAYDPSVLLMDEPFGALDAQTKRRMIRDLLRIWQDARKTVLFVTHSVEEALYLSDRIFVFSARPSVIKEVITVELPRPREIDDPRFVALERRLLLSLDEEVDRMMRLEERPTDDA